VDKKKLLKYAIDYLSKYDSSKSNLVNVLKRKILRLKITNFEKRKLINSIEEIIIILEQNKFIDDDRYSSTKIQSLSNSGKSKNFIINYLVKKGVNKLEIQNNLNLIKQDNDNWELESAKIFAKKKKLLEKNESYEKKLAKMARAGFSYDICKKILG
tara:strand:- start:168 stop:638 length:471 start_codon:yes stop_codon:yes gene_type:complete